MQTVRLATNKLSANRTAAIIVWLVGAFTTGLAIKQTGVLDETASYALGASIQALLTVLERPVWRGTRASWIAFCALFFDAFCNFGGVWAFANRLDQTTAWASVNEALHTQQGIPTITKLVIALVFSVFIAAAPETLWKEG